MNIKERGTKMMKRWVTGLLLVVWMAVIFAFSNQVAEESAQSSQTVAYQIASWQNKVFQLEKGEEELVAQADSMQFSIRKCAHMCEYAVLAVLFFLHLGCYPLDRKWAVALAWAFTVCYAALDEGHQLLVMGRSGEMRDVCIDGIGGLIGLGVVLGLGKVAERRKKQKQAQVGA